MRSEGRRGSDPRATQRGGRGLLCSLTSGRLINEVAHRRLGRLGSPTAQLQGHTRWTEESCLPTMERRVRVKSWVEENRASFQPPVCNKLM